MIKSKYSMDQKKELSPLKQFLRSRESMNKMRDETVTIFSIVRMNCSSQNALKRAMERSPPAPKEFAATSTVRIATAEDHSVLLELINSAFYEHNWYKKENCKHRVTPETLRDYMANQSNFYLLMENIGADQKSVPLACVYVRMENDDRFKWQQHPGIMMFSIDPFYKHRGLGKYIFQLASECIGSLFYSNRARKEEDRFDSDIDLASESGIIQIEVTELNDHLVQMYQKWGFVIDRIWSAQEYGLKLEDLEIETRIVILHRSIKGI